MFLSKEKYGQSDVCCVCVCGLCGLYYLVQEKRAVCACGLCMVCFLGKKKYLFLYVLHVWNIF